MSPTVDGSKLRELDPEKPRELDGLWVASGIGDRLATPPTPLTLDFVLQDSVLLGSAFSRRGVSLPRLTRRVARVSGHVYHAALPLIRAARAIAPLDAKLVALTFAAEARRELGRLLPARPSASGFALRRLAKRLHAAHTRFEQAVLVQERDGSQHFRWLVEMDLGILPDDALGTTLEECVAIERGTRALEIDVSLELLTSFAALGLLLQRADVPLASSLAGLVAPEPLEFASSTPAMALASLVRRAEREGPASGARHGLSLEFVRGYGERGPDERELTSPRWRERSQALERLLALALRLGPTQYEQRLSLSHQRRREHDERIRGGLERGDAALLSTLVPLARGLARLRSRLHLVRARTLSMLRTAVLDIDRRLVRLAGCEPGAAFFLELDELLSATTRPNAELARRSAERRRAWTSRARADAPPALLGPGLATVPETSEGVGLGGAEVTGPATVARRFEDALSLAPGGVLIVRSLDAGWGPLLPVAGAVITETGGLADEGVMVALSLGVPVVLGVPRALARFTSGEVLRVSASEGTVAAA